jgi:UDP-glucuronate 4-epimerase
MTRYLLTGAAGFIGFHVARRLLDRGDEVVGIDNLSAYYDVGLKRARLAQLEGKPGWRFLTLDIADRAAVASLFPDVVPSVVIHLAAQAGVRHSLDNPHDYVSANLVGFANILEGCRRHGLPHLVYASSSSVYGGNTRMPFSVHDNVDHPVSLYAATKKANELMAHSYSHLFGLPATGLRFFTVYGPWGRPDMAYFKFTHALLADEPVELFGDGSALRDFTYIDDIADGVVRVADRPPAARPAIRPDPPDPGSSPAPWRVYNIGNDQPVAVRRLLDLLEQETGRQARIVHRGEQPGDVPATWADVDDLRRDVGFAPGTALEEGLHRFVKWYREYYRV